MAIKGINGADLNNISEVDGRYNVLKKVNGVGVDANLSPPAAAYSVRNLSTLTVVTYDGPCMRILVDAAGDGADATDLEYDINFTADGDLDTADIELKCTGGKDAYVVKWYDQSGAGNDAVQDAYAAMPKICSAGTVITENGKPALDFDGVGQYFQSNGFADDFNGEDVAMSFISVSSPDATGDFFMWGLSGTNSTWQTCYLRSTGDIQVRKVDDSSTSSTITRTGSYSTGQQLFTAVSNGTTTSVYVDTSVQVNAASIDVGASTFTTATVGASATPSAYLNGQMQEFVLWVADQSSNRPTIEKNINSYFNIYSSGLLAEYPGSVAAYSVRKLVNTAGLSMRIIVDDTAVIGTLDASDTEYDIGFDANGELDVARIREVCNNPSGANYNAYVVTWYDQSGNGNHATQTTYTQCPKIYDGTDVIMVNGKPCVEFVRTSTTGLLTPSETWSTAGDMAYFAVFADTGNVSDQFTWNASAGSGRSFALLTPQQDAANIYGATTIQLVGTSPSGQQLTTYNHESTNAVLYANGSSIASSSTAPNHNVASKIAGIGFRSSGNEGYSDVLLQEIVHYPVHQTSNRKAIESDINSYYRIYGDPDDGLLSTPYGKGAAAAYSVRKLSSNATRAMRIIVDDTATVGTLDASDTEYDIGFDANGELDIARIEEVCDKGSGNYNAYLVTWYDQSGGGNHATQATYSNMPQIASSGSVVLENGKPAVQFVRSGATGTSLLTPSISWSTAGELQFFMVFNNESTSGNQETWSNASNRMFTGAATNFVNTAAGNLPYTLSKIADQNLFVYEHNSTARTIYIDGTQDATSASPVNASTAPSGGALGRRYNGAEGHATVLWQELIHYPTNQSSNRPLIESNINDYFNIEGV